MRRSDPTLSVATAADGATYTKCSIPKCGLCGEERETYEHKRAVQGRMPCAAKGEIT